MSNPQENLIGAGRYRGCSSCKHIHSHTLFTTCEAFPDGIPTFFANGDDVHDKPFPGDHGIQYEPNPTPTVDELIADLERRYPELLDE